MRSFGISGALLRKGSEWGMWILDLLLPPHPDDIRLRGLTPQKLTPQNPPATGEPDTIAAFSYDDPVAHALIHGIKFRKQKSYGAMMGYALGYLLSETLTDGEWIVIAIPASLAGKRERGFDQGECIAKATAHNLGPRFLYVPEVLCRTRKSMPQTRFHSRNERQQAIVGAFLLANGPAVQNKLVLLIDDVRTTGATLREASTLLSRGGARKVVKATFAQTPPIGRGPKIW